MPKEPVVSNTETTAAGAAGQTLTPWGVFTRARLKPSEIKCQAYQPMHFSEQETCHTRLPLSAQSFLTHLQAHDCGGFQVTLKPTDGKPWAGWEELRALGLEIQDFRCEVCGNPVRLTAQYIQQHLKPHRGKFKNAYQFFQNKFNLTVGYAKPLDDSDTDPDQD